MTAHSTQAQGGAISTLQVRMLFDQQIHMHFFKESLREKEAHIEQLIRERDVERNEMARISNRCEIAEQKLSQAMMNNSAEVDTARMQCLQSMLDECEKQKRTFADQCDEERK